MIANSSVRFNLGTVSLDLMSLCSSQSFERKDKPIGVDTVKFAVCKTFLVQVG